MSFVRVRSLRTWLLGLYLVAQVAVVVPIMCVHTLNNDDTSVVAGHVHVPLANDTGRPDANHHQGIIGFCDECCANHSLSGILPPPAVSVSLAETAGTPITAAALIAFVNWRPDRLDRPPKSLPSI